MASSLAGAHQGREPEPIGGRAVGFDAERFLPDTEAAQLIPRSVAARYLVAPLSLEGNTLRVAMKDPRNLETIDYIEMITKMHPVGVAVPEDQLRDLIQRIYGSSMAGPDVLEATVAEAIRLSKETAEGTELPIVRLVDQILAEGVRTGATDIHIQPEETETVVRFRLDGILGTMTRLPRQVHVPIATRVKILSDLDISERRIPQDGEMQLHLGEKKIDFRVSTLPTVFGENVVMRLLDHSKVRYGLADLGYARGDRDKLELLLKRPNGILLVTGPTGSGKSTTLYAALRMLDSEALNIMTLEDPVEYQLEGIRQSQIAEKAGFTFASGLRALMRQDPDVILVGEMRDQETTEIALRASLTGHLVLSTLHTTSAIGAVSRLRDMGIQDFLLSATLAGLVAQRLVRRVCAECSEPVEASASEKRYLGIDPEQKVLLRRGKGCKACGGTGYKGRFALYELIEMTPELREAISRGASEAEILRTALAGGLVPMRTQGIDRVLEGWTTNEELTRVVN